MSDESKGEAHIKVNFEVEQDEDGYPPASVETLWAQMEKDGTYLIDSIPFFINEISCGDRILARVRRDGLWFDRVIQKSNHSTIRVIIFREDQVSDIRRELDDLGCSSELSHIPTLIAVDVPGEVNYELVRACLEELSGEGVADYEEAAVRHGIEE